MVEPIVLMVTGSENVSSSEQGRLEWDEETKQKDGEQATIQLWDTNRGDVQMFESEDMSADDVTARSHQITLIWFIKSHLDK